jgi:hypothetical protein
LPGDLKRNGDAAARQPKNSHILAVRVGKKHLSQAFARIGSVTEHGILPA